MAGNEEIMNDGKSERIDGVLSKMVMSSVIIAAICLPYFCRLIVYGELSFWSLFLILFIFPVLSGILTRIFEKLILKRMGISYDSWTHFLCSICSIIFWPILVFSTILYIMVYATYKFYTLVGDVISDTTIEILNKGSEKNDQEKLYQR